MSDAPTPTSSAATLGAGPARRADDTVEGPTLHDREIGFGFGHAAPDRSPTCLGRSSRTSVCASGPGRRQPRVTRLTRALLLVVTAALVAGCGGDDTLATSQAGAGTPAGATPAGNTPTPGTTVNGSADGQQAQDGAAAANRWKVPGYDSVISSRAAAGTRMVVSVITPAAFKRAYCRQPIIVVFYQPDAVVDERFLEEVRAVAATVDDELLLLYTPKDVRAAGDLPDKLGLLATPSVAVVSRGGIITNFWDNYIDRGLLQSSVANAVAARPCSATGANVPPVGSGLGAAADAAAS